MLSLCLYFSLTLFAPAQTLALAAATESGVTGTLKRHEQFRSRHVSPRNVDVWLPPGYAKHKHKRFPVIYMHDGQNLFDPKLSFGGVDWGVDETMRRLAGERKIREAIIVGVWNTPQRLAEYMPRKAVAGAGAAVLKGVPALRPDEILSDEYLKFLVEELKPFVDSEYRTLPRRADTFIMGSSMGGLISLYALAEYPQVFGGAACVSTHFPAGDGSVIEYMRGRLPSPKTHRIYFDYGTEALDAAYEPYQMRMDAVMRVSGYEERKNWITRKYVGADHSERAWRERVDVPLTFLLRR